MSLQILILAAGQGTRMKSKHPKVLHKVAGKAMIDHVLEQSRELTEEKPLVVIGHQADLLEEHLAETADTVLQKEQLGTGHAVMMAANRIKDESEVMVLCADTPLIQHETLAKMLQLKHQGYAAVMMSSIVTDPTGYGRVIRDSDDHFIGITEQKDATTAELEIREINAGMYIFDGKLLKENLKKLSSDNAQREYYLTDVLEYLSKDAHSIGILQVSETEIMGVNTRVQLALAEEQMRRRINESHMLQGVTIIDPLHTYIEKEVQIGEDTVIYPNCHLKGKTVIGSDCSIREGTTIENSVIGNGVTIKSSTLLESEVGDETTVGPYAYLRPKSILGKKVKIGDFVEVKNAVIGDGSKASHLSYIGDAEVGKEVNIGCGVVFVNYDGKHKFRSVVKDQAFIGSNSNLVAPVIVEEGGYVATGSTVTIDVPKQSLCIARARESIKKDWRLKKGL